MISPRIYIRDILLAAIPMSAVSMVLGGVLWLGLVACGG